MQIEYLLLDLLIIAGPLALSFDKKVRYVRYWADALFAAALVMIPFILWDALVTGRHWMFNHEYTLTARLFGLPPGEWLFFLAVPFSCLFVWQIIVTHHPAKPLAGGIWIARTLMLLVIPGIWFFVAGREYTALVCLALAVTGLIDSLSGRLLLQKRLYPYLLILAGLMLIFNGYLTARPVVMYTEAYQLGFRVWTIPVEDFGYGYSHLLLCTIVFEWIKGKRHGT